MKTEGITYSADVLALNPQLRGIIEEAIETPSKYHNVRTESKGMRFQSGREAAEITKLIILDERHQGVFGLRLQVRFPLGDNDVYVADATYLDEKLKGHIVDAKGYRTREYLKKRRLFNKYYGQNIEEM